MILRFDEFELDTEYLELRQAGKLVKADRVVLLALACLARNAGRLVTKDELVEQVWEGRPVTDTVITVATARLRKTLGQRRGGREFIENVYGRGYRFLRAVAVEGSTARSAPALVDARSNEPPFVGRERVLHRLAQALGQARAGRGRLCSVLGEAGIGKTALVEAFERELSETGTAVVWGFCRESGDTPPLWPMRRVLQQIVATLDPQELAQQLGALYEPLCALMQANGSPGAAAVSRYSLFDAIIRSLDFAASKAPLVVVLDDLHRADSATLELLSQLVDEIARTRVLLIVTLRSTRDDDAGGRAAHLSYVLGHRNSERLVLEPLGELEVRRYAEAVLGDAALARVVFDKSEGNPFFMTELTRQLSDLQPREGEQLSVPDAALGLVRQRLAALEDPSREALSVAAVIGRSFELPVLQGVTGSDTAALMSSLDEALGAELLVAAPDSNTAFAFRHELFRAAIYDALPKATRRGLHARTALVLEQRLMAGDAVPPSELAFHFHAALPDGDPRKTVDYCRAAATAASGVFANADVVRYLRNALQALELADRPSPRLRMALLQGIVMHTRTTDPEEFERVTRELLRLASERADGANLVMLGVMLNPSMGLKPAPFAREAHSRALPSLRDDEVGLRALALAGLSCLPPACYEVARSDELIEQATRLSRSLTVSAVDHGVLSCRLYLRGGPAHDAEEQSLRAELERIAREQPRRTPVLPAELAFSRAITALQRGEVAATSDAIERCRVRARQIDQREHGWLSERAAVLMQLNAGTAQDPVAALSQLHRRAEQQSLVRVAPFCGFDRAVVVAELGQKPALDDKLRSDLAYDATEPPSLWAMKVRALAAAGWVDAAHASLRAVAPDALARLPCDRDYLGTLGHLTRAVLSLGVRDYAEALYALLSPYPERYAVHVSFLCEGSVAQLLGMLADALGRKAEASAHLTTALQLNERAGLGPRVAEVRALLGQRSG